MECFKCGQCITTEQFKIDAQSRTIHASANDCIEMLKVANRIILEGAGQIIKENERLRAELESVKNVGKPLTLRDEKDQIVLCGVCRQRMVLVRPGKWQCNHCEESGWHPSLSE